MASSRSQVTQMVPSDFQVKYDYREGSVPPPHHAEYTIRVSGDGKASIRYRPDYPADGVPIWEETFNADKGRIGRLSQLMEKAGVWKHTWSERKDPRVGGELRWMTATANGETVRIPGDLEDRRGIDAVYAAIEELVPRQTWRKLSDRRRRYIQRYEQKGPRPNESTGSATTRDDGRAPGKEGVGMERWKQIIEAEWRKIDPNKSATATSAESPPPVMWEYRVSPPFPANWPPRLTMTVFYYVFAGGVDLSTPDGERISAPWARLEVVPHHETAAQLQVLSTSLREIGLHGVRPLGKQEVAIHESRPDAESLLLAMTELPNGADETTRRIRSFYCAWCANSGVAEQVRPYHESFFQWLRCEDR